MDRVNEQGHHCELHNRHCRQEVRALKVGILCYTQELINIQYFHRKHLLLLMIYLDIQVSRLLWLCKVFTSGQLWARSSFTRQGKKQQQPRSFIVINSLPSAAVHAKGSHKAPTGAPSTPKAHSFYKFHLTLSERDIPYSDSMLLRCCGNSIVKIKLTVGEGEAWSDITFRDSCMKATNKKDSEGWETEPSHAHCPHASSGPPANLHYLPFRFLGTSWRAFFKAVFIFSPSLFFPAPRLLEWRVCALSWSQTPSGRQKMMLVWTICDLRTWQKASTDQPPCVHVTAGSQLRSVMMKEQDWN